MASIGIETQFTFGRKVRRAAIALAVAVATPLAIASVMIGTSGRGAGQEGLPEQGRRRLQEELQARVLADRQERLLHAIGLRAELVFRL